MHGGSTIETWTDTHYQLTDNDWIYVAQHADRGTASLICPGRARDGNGFSIYFTPTHLPMLEQLLQALRSVDGRSLQKNNEKNNAQKNNISPQELPKESLVERPTKQPVASTVR